MSSVFSVNKLACILKDSNVEIRKKNGVISGATDSTCGKIIFFKGTPNFEILKKNVSYCDIY